MTTPTETNEAFGDFEEEPEAAWRRLALQFDGHHMQALWHLRCMLKDPVAHKEAAEKFLSEGPLSGEEVLAARIKAVALSEKTLS